MPKPMTERMKKATKKAAEPLWTGPCGEGPNGGCTQSLVSSWLVDRERHRVQYILGLQPTDSMNHRIEYGSMFHVCIEALDKGPSLVNGWCPVIEAALNDYCRELCKQYPLQQDQVVHWASVCKVQFPAYVRYWQKHKDTSGEVHTPLLQEQAFDVPYTLPSGRVVRLRGKWDGVELIHKAGKSGTKSKTVNNPGIWLDENKTKGDVDEVLLRRQLKFDLQTMWYLTALNEYDLAAILEPMGVKPSFPLIKGVRYNVIRRPLSGGKGSIRQSEGTKGSKCPKCKGVAGNMSCPKCRGEGRVGAKPAETSTEFYARLGGIIGAEPEAFFMRWTSEVSPQDVEKFKRQFLEPVCENMADDAEWWTYCLERGLDRWDYTFRAKAFPEHKARHYRMPYGVYSPLLDSRPTDLDSYLDDGTVTGLRRADKLFRELGQ